MTKSLVLIFFIIVIVIIIIIIMMNVATTGFQVAYIYSSIMFIVATGLVFFILKFKYYFDCYLAWLLYI